MTTLTLIQCGPCGGHMFPGYNVNTGLHIFAMCDDCGHEVAESDITPNLDAGEMLAWDSQGRLAYAVSA